jgi:hypothetical protein
MDVHRQFAQLAMMEDGPVGDEGRIRGHAGGAVCLAVGLRGDIEVALEATGNSDTIGPADAAGKANRNMDTVDALMAQLLAADWAAAHFADSVLVAACVVPA